MKNSYKFYSNKECAFFPCHPGVPEEEFNCLFCYCPLYFLGEKCGGGFKKAGSKEYAVKDCSACLITHKPEGYDFVMAKIAENIEGVL